MTFDLRRSISALFGAAVLFFAGTVTAAAGLLLGDADSDGKVTVVDATQIQRQASGLRVCDKFSEDAADVDRSGRIEITDATFVQRFSSNLPTPHPIGTECVEPTETPTEQPTEQPTEPPTEQPTEQPTQMPTDEDGWSHTIFRP